MERPSREEFATRFATYVSELREIFASRDLRFGRPKDVTAVAQALSAPGALQDDATAVIRSILYREHEGLSRTELVSVVVVAAGGADLYGSAREGDAVKQLDTFVNGVRLAMRAMAPAQGELEGVTEVQATPNDLRSEEHSAAEIPLHREEVYAENDMDEVLAPVALRAERASVLAGVYSQAQRMSEGERESDAGGEGTYFLKAKAETEFEAPPVEDDRKTLEDRVAGPYLGWVVGLCVLVVLLAAGLVWRHRSAARVEDVAREAGSARGVAAESASTTAGAMQGGLPQIGAATAHAAVVSRAGGSPIAGSASGFTSEPGRADAAGPSPASGDHVAASPATTSTPAVEAASLPPPSEKASQPAVASAPAPKPKYAASPTTTAAQPAVAGSPTVAGKYVVSSGVMSGNLVSAPEPAYPKMAKMWGIEGQVILQAVISSKGQVVATHVLDGHKMLRASAMHAVRKWRYKPYVVEGKATDVATVVIVDYKLKP